MVEKGIIEIFLEEASEEIVDMEELILSLEKDPEAQELIDNLFRVVHTIKGSAGLAGLEHITNFMHYLEDLLEKMRRKELIIDSNLISILLESHDIVSKMLAGLKNEKSDFSQDELNKLLDKILFFLDDEKRNIEDNSNVKQDKNKSSRYYHIFMKFPEDLIYTGTDPLMLLSELDEAGKIIDINVGISRLPTLDDMDVHKLYLNWSLTLLSDFSNSQLEDIFIFVEDESKIIIKDITDEIKKPGKNAELRVGELLINEGLIEKELLYDILDRQKRLGDILVEEVKVTDKQINKIVKKQRESREALQSKTVRVDGSKLKEMINLVAELVIKQSRLKDLVINKLGESNEQKVNKQEIEATIQEVDKTIRDLQEKIMQANMVAVGDTFVRFRRLVRDLAEQAGKDIELKLIGTETELDKKVIEKIVDPLKHMIRNAVDHGIETVEERKAKGKSEKAVIKLSALQQEGGIIIEVEDDGRGLDASKIRKKAIENNLISESDSLSDDEIYQLIFEPGFSTSDSVSELSGRGVGMDVVATNIKELQGKVELKSEAGKGTKFIIKLPLTLAIIDGMLVKVANQLLIIPLSALVEFIELKLEQIKKVKEKGQVIAVRGNYIPLYFLDKLLNFDAESSNGKSNLVAIVKNEDTEIAISLDEILGQQQVVIKSLEKNFVNLKGISGATILGNGNVALILDIQALINLASA